VVEDGCRRDADEQPLATAGPGRALQLHEHRLLFPRGLPVPAGCYHPPPATSSRGRLPQAEEVCRLPIIRAYNNQLRVRLAFIILFYLIEIK
jgi:hypothetical protein